MLCNTKIYCLTALSVSHPAPLGPDFIVRNRWPQSNQVEKKRETIRRHLDGLVKSGYAFKCGDRYLISGNGLRAQRQSIDDQGATYTVKTVRAPLLKVVR